MDLSAFYATQSLHEELLQGSSDSDKEGTQLGRFLNQKRLVSDLDLSISL